MIEFFLSAWYYSRRAPKRRKKKRDKTRTLEWTWSTIFQGDFFNAIDVFCLFVFSTIITNDIQNIRIREELIEIIKNKKKRGARTRERKRNNIVEFLNCYYNMLSLWWYNPKTSPSQSTTTKNENKPKKKKTPKNEEQEIFLDGIQQPETGWYVSNCDERRERERKITHTHIHCTQKGTIFYLRSQKKPKRINLFLKKEKKIT